MSVNQDKSKVPNGKQNERGFFFKGVLIPALVSIVVASVTTVITLNIQSAHERPEIKILGAMPIHLYEILSGPEGTKFRTHKLAFIFKIENPSPSSTMAHMAMFEGCTPIPPLVADAHMPKNERIPSGTINPAIK